MSCIYEVPNIYVSVSMEQIVLVKKVNVRTMKNKNKSYHIYIFIYTSGVRIYVIINVRLYVECDNKNCSMCESFHLSKGKKCVSH